jgi:hypothetical protein
VTQAYALPEPSFGASVVGQTGAFSWHSGNETDYSLGITGAVSDEDRAARASGEG